MENNLNKHISGRFNEELESVRNHVLSMGGLVEQRRWIGAGSARK